MIRVDVEPPDRILVYIVRRQQRCFSLSPAEAAQLAAELGQAARELTRILVPGPKTSARDHARRADATTTKGKS